MGFLKNIFRGGKKKNKNGEDPAPSPPAATPVAAAAAANASSGSNGKKSGRQPWGSRGKDRRSASSAAASSTASSVASLRSPRGAGAPVCVDDDGLIPEGHASLTTNKTYTGSTSSRERDTELLANGGGAAAAAAAASSPRLQTQEQLRIAYEQSRAKKVSPTHRVLDENDDPSNVPVAAGAGANESLSPRLTTNQLQQWDRHSNGVSPPLGGMATSSSRPVYTMSSELPGQQMQAMDDMNRSDASSSSFNLSTDAEDSEYEMFKRRGGYPGVHNSSTLDTSAIDTVTSYTTDEDRKIFPNLPTDDEMTQATEPSQKESQPPSLLMPLHTPDDEPGRISIFAQQNDAFDDFRSWATSTGPQEPPSTKSSASRDRHFFPASGGGVGNNVAAAGGPDPTKKRSTPTSASVSSHSASRNAPGATHRNFTSPKSHASSNTDFSAKEFGKDFRDNGFGNDFSDFGNFADFSNFPSSAGDANGWKGEEKKVQPWEESNEPKRPSPSIVSTMAPHPSTWMAASATGIEAISTSTNPNTSVLSTSNKNADTSRGSGVDSTFETAGLAPSQASASSSGFLHDTSLSELLEAAKSKRRGGGRSNRINVRPTSSSVNSAPAITAAYLRQHHNLGGRYSAGNYSTASGSGNLDREKGGDGTSVSDIIESLEATDRMKRGGLVYAHRSVGDTGAVATARAAKERLREKRRRDRELGIHNSRSTELSDSEESDHEASESWLFDEVTGALGPRGIAADLESLSGRSNRSKNSHGNKSHKSSRRKSSSRKSSSRRKPSDRSVDSHGSRQSRYSHRSTKSFLSQMSEQSRSVANDLLRLEMQLAMVGSQEIRDDAPARPGSSGASLGGGGASRGASRSVGRKSLNTSRNVQTAASSVSSSAIARRTKITVIAPPGKLGIILANKADSKGTVVSGVRTSSVLVDRISPGDRIVAIDGEDVSRMTVSEITTIMSRKAEYERRLTVLTVPKGGNNSPSEGMRSPTNSAKMTSDFDNSFSSNTFRR